MFIYVVNFVKIIVLVLLIFLWLNILIFLHNFDINSYLSNLDKNILKTNKQIDQVKPKIKLAKKKVDNIYDILKSQNNNILKVWVITDNSLKSIDNIQKNLDRFNKISKFIDPYLRKLNKQIDIASNDLQNINPSLNSLVFYTHTINNILSNINWWLQKINWTKWNVDLNIIDFWNINNFMMWSNSRRNKKQIKKNITPSKPIKTSTSSDMMNMWWFWF